MSANTYAHVRVKAETLGWMTDWAIALLRNSHRIDRVHYSKFTTTDVAQYGKHSVI